MCIDKFKVKDDDTIEVIEHAPGIFRNIRKELCSEHKILEAMIPSKNYEAIHNFETGQGKSPSFFFFSDDHSLLIKTLQKGEWDIIKKSDFLVDYIIHLKKNPKSLLSRYMGIYEVNIGS